MARAPPAAPPRRATGLAAARFILVLLLLAAMQFDAVAAATPSSTEMPNVPGFWHYTLMGSPGGIARVVWSALPGWHSNPAPSYAVQGWNSSAMPVPPQENWNSSLMLEPGTRYTHNATDGTYGVTMPTRGQDQGRWTWYRVVALASDGAPLAATAAAPPLDPNSMLLVSPRGCAPFKCSASIRDAVGVLPKPNATVTLLPGTYRGEGNTNITISSTNTTIQGVPGLRDAVVIDCNNASRAFLFTSSTSESTVLKDLTIANGSAGPLNEGGCISIEGGSPTISGCSFQGCRANLGGAVHVSGASSAPLILGSSFVSNGAQRGGGLRVTSGARATVDGCSFVGNQAADGVGVGAGIVFDQAGACVVRNTNVTGGRVGFTGGGIGAESSQLVTLDRVRVRDNYSSSHAGGLLLFGSNITAINCDISNNTAASFGGGVLAQYANYTAINTTHNDNRALYGGGAIKLYSATGHVVGGEVSRNYAPYGAGFEVATITQTQIPVASSVTVLNTWVEGNVVVDRGAGFFVDSADSVQLSNVTFVNNTAGSRGGAVYCNSNGTTSAVTLNSVQLLSNSAPTGGGIFAFSGCNINVFNSTLRRNMATDGGAGMAVADGAHAAIVNSSFVDNGTPFCNLPTPPARGGGLYIGLKAFSPAATCDTPSAPAKLAAVSLQGVVFQGNRAAGQGGGLHLAAGSLSMQDVTMVGNEAAAEGDSDGAGGAISVQERCGGDTCDPVQASLLRVTFTANGAARAGGAIYYAATSNSSGLAVSESEFTGNTANAQLQGMGGALFLAHPSFSLTSTTLANNSAYLGGGLFLSADLSKPGAVLSQLTVTGNSAAGMGPAVYWLRSKSPAADFLCESCCVQAEGAAPPGAATCNAPPPAGALPFFATEALHIDWVGPPPSLVQTGHPMPPFSVRLLDYYESTVVTENGTAVVALGSKSAASLSGSGTEEAVRGGVANFTDATLRGTINETYALQVIFSRSLGGPSRFMEPAQVPPLNFSVSVTPCAPGSQPNSEGNDCTECSAGTFSFDGVECLPCPKGAVCRGGADISSQRDFWRATPASSDFHPCKALGICLASNATGDGACRSGQMGPLCDVCWQGYFKFAGACRECKSSGQATAMLVVMVVAFAVLTVALFARSWDFGHGPGIMTKIKIFLTHFQMIALFRDYDVVWPGATKAALSWFEMANLGFVMLAPECFFGDYNFYMLYIFQMVLPFACVGLCVLLFYAAELWLWRLDPAGQRRAAGMQAGGLVGWLEGLKIRCWKNAFWFVTLLYPRCAMTALQLFGWQRLETGTFLKADYSIMVKLPDGRLVGTFVGFLVPGILLLFLFAVFIPGFWFFTVWSRRHRLDDPVVQAKFGFLYESYSPRFPYWETTEMMRKFVIALIPVFVPAQVEGSLQAAVGQAVLLVYILVTQGLWPFAANIDNWLQLASLTVLWLLLLTAGVNKWVSLSASGSKAMAGIQLTMSSGIGFLLGCAVIFSALRMVRQFTRRKVEARRSRKDSLASSAASEAALVPGSTAGAGSATGSAPLGPADPAEFSDFPLRMLSKRASAPSAAATIAVHVTAKQEGAGGSLGALSFSDAGEICAARASVEGANMDGASLGLALGSFTVHQGLGAEGGAGLAQSPGSLAGIWCAEDAVPDLPRRESFEPGEEPVPRWRTNPLSRTASNMSRRSAADDVEMQLSTMDVLFSGAGSRHRSRSASASAAQLLAPTQVVRHGEEQPPRAPQPALRVRSASDALLHLLATHNILGIPGIARQNAR